MWIVRTALACAALAMALPAFSQAIAPGEEGELANLLAPEAGRRICFGRIYTREHLAKHPKQKVTEIGFRLAYHRFEPDEFYPKGQRNYYFAMTAKRRGSDRTLVARGECGPNGSGIGCGVECDGGGVSLTRRPGDRLLVTLGKGGWIRMTEGCDEEEGGSVNLEAGEDDRDFLLSRLPDASCPPWSAW
jgi:hypothetical protein